MLNFSRKFRLMAVMLFLFGFGILYSGCASMKPQPRYNKNRSTPVPQKQDTRSKSKATPPSKQAKPSSKDIKRMGGSDALSREVSNWWGTPYQMGGNKRRYGVDCSAYVKAVYKTVYGINLPRTSGSQYTVGVAVPRKNLRRGDLVFFNTSGRGVSHVGIYLGKERFTHASNSDGVTINSLKDSYYKKRYVGARRVRR